MLPPHQKGNDEVIKCVCVCFNKSTGCNIGQRGWCCVPFWRKAKPEGLSSCIVLVLAAPIPEPIVGVHGMPWAVHLNTDRQVQPLVTKKRGRLHPGTQDAVNCCQVLLSAGCKKSQNVESRHAKHRFNTLVHFYSNMM